MSSIKTKIKAAKLTPLQKQVYLYLLTIPKGQVTTYKAIGEAIGSTAYRAIGQACAKNPFIPEVPCHRVVGANGTLTGYAKGLPAKIALLRSEGVAIVGEKVTM